MIPEEAREAFRTWGYACLPRVVENGLLDELRAVHAALPAERYLQQRYFWSARHLSAEHDAFRRLGQEGAFPRIAAALLDVPRLRLLFDQIILKPAGAAATPWHQDQPSLCIDPFRICTFWIPLRDVVPEEGAIHFAHHSQRTELPVHGLGLDPEAGDNGDALVEAGYRQQVPRAHAAGSCTVHDGWAVHGARANRSRTDRPAINLVYYDGDARVTESERDWRRARDRFFPGREAGELADTCPLVFDGAGMPGGEP